MKLINRPSSCHYCKKNFKKNECHWHEDQKYKKWKVRCFVCKNMKREKALNSFYDKKKRAEQSLSEINRRDRVRSLTKLSNEQKQKHNFSIRVRNNIYEVDKFFSSEPIQHSDGQLFIPETQVIFKGAKNFKGIINRFYNDSGFLEHRITFIRNEVKEEMSYKFDYL